MHLIYQKAAFLLFPGNANHINVIFPNKCDISDIGCLCITYAVGGDVSLLLTLYRYAISNDSALKRLVGSFAKFGISSYFAKDNFDDFFHIDESGSIFIVTQIYDDDDAGNVYHFEIKKPFNKKIEEIEFDKWFFGMENH